MLICRFEIIKLSLFVIMRIKHLVINTRMPVGTRCTKIYQELRLTSLSVGYA